MVEPVTTTGATLSTLTGVAFFSFLAGLPVDVVLGAFAGAFLSVVSASDHGIRSRLMLAIGSFTAGLTIYKPVAALIIDYLPDSYNRGADAAGALLAAGCVIRLLMVINSGGGFLKKKEGKGGGDDLQ